jgi:hypothetical protein
MTEDRFKLAAVIAPLVPAIIVVFVPMILTHDQVFGNALPLAVFFIVVTSYLGLFAALPLIIFLKRRGRLTFISLSALGVTGGVVLFGGFHYVFALMLGTQEYYTYDIRDAIWGALLSLAVAIPFGLIAGITSQPSPTR